MMEKDKIEIPKTCPSCESVLENVNGQLFCRNDKCPAQNSKAVEHLAKVLKIKGLGPKTIEKLGMNSIDDVYSMGIDKFIEVLGEKVATKLYTEIRDSASADLELVLQALGITMFGETASKKICSVVNNIYEITEEKCKEAGLGPSNTATIIKWLRNNRELLKSLPFDYISKTKPQSVVLGSVCITGHLNNFASRTLAKEYLLSHGYAVTDTITSKTTALICEDNKESSKTLQARAKNIPILTIEKLIQKDIIKNDNKI